MKDNPNNEPAIGLILRNNLSLCKMVFKHLELKCENSDLTEFYKAVFGENLKRTIKFLKKNHSNEDLQPIIDDIKNSFPFLIQETGLNLDTIESEIFRFSYKLPANYESLDNLYIAYSKYEHFGLNTLILQENNSTSDIFERIKIAIHYSLQGILSCLSMLGILDEELMNLNNELRKSTDACKEMRADKR